MKASRLLVFIRCLLLHCCCRIAASIPLVVIVEQDDPFDTGDGNHNLILTTDTIHQWVTTSKEFRKHFENVTHVEYIVSIRCSDPQDNLSLPAKLEFLLLQDGVPHWRQQQGATTAKPSSLSRSFRISHHQSTSRSVAERVDLSSLFNQRKPQSSSSNWTPMLALTVPVTNSSDKLTQYLSNSTHRENWIRLPLYIGRSLHSKVIRLGTVIDQNQGVTPSSTRLAEQICPILQKTPTKVDVLTYNDVSLLDGDARDELGQLGYKHDETFLKPVTTKAASTLSVKDMKDWCPSSSLQTTSNGTASRNAKPIRDKIKVAPATNSSVKVMCSLYTIVDDNRETVREVRETWGPKCDGFLAFTGVTNQTRGTVDITYIGENSYSNRWQRLRSLLVYLYNNYFERYDWFFISEVDTHQWPFLIVENLRAYLGSRGIETAQDRNGGESIPLFIGRRMACSGDQNHLFNMGSAGYVINKATLKTLVLDGLPFYETNTTSIGADVILARVLKKLGVLPYDSRDNYGSERFMPFEPKFHYEYRYPISSEASINEPDWYGDYSLSRKEGIDHFSTHSISFGRATSIMQGMYAFLYGECRS